MQKMHHLTAPWYADKTDGQARGVYLFMAVGACINATALSVGGMGVETSLLPQLLSDRTVLYM